MFDELVRPGIRSLTIAAVVDDQQLGRFDRRGDPQEVHILHVHSDAGLGQALDAREGAGSEAERCLEDGKMVGQAHHRGDENQAIRAQPSVLQRESRGGPAHGVGDHSVRRAVQGRD
ncbi:hypothetical protein [Aeromicrobium sp.]|uniref:hypothetical protein n=1 Tax=Aeromicrobium sp. TaxID=1871063 RepID=UPI0030BC8F63